MKSFVGQHEAAEAKQTYLTEAQVEAVDDALKDYLSCAYDCTELRGPRGFVAVKPDNDFPISDDDPRIEEIRDAVLEVLGLHVREGENHG